LFDATLQKLKKDIELCMGESPKNAKIEEEQNETLSLTINAMESKRQ